MGLKEKYQELESSMITGKNVENMKLFGRVMNSMMYELIATNPNKAEEYIECLEAIRWKNYLTKREAEGIVEGMIPEAPWSKEQWKLAMTQAGYDIEKNPHYNCWALWVTMNMIMSDSGQTLGKYIENGKLFSVVYALAVDKLTDKDEIFNIRKYFDI